MRVKFIVHLQITHKPCYKRVKVIVLQVSNLSGTVYFIFVHIRIWGGEAVLFIC